MENCNKCGATMTAVSENKFVCEFCGNTVEKKSKNQHHNYHSTRTTVQPDITNVNKNEEKLGCWLTGLCAIIPLVGLILFIVYLVRGEKAKATSAIVAAVIGFVIGIILDFSGFWEGFWEGFYGDY
ncbi:MAG: DUF2029 domain-containing protein [Bacteroidales bacterium]|jgi:DNA-directed RNA polymerase subunit M/transcription elongation factor TFIIS|nr:DUF2029 domain-containing protein [Bacteroidales bacterium]